jgi:hypothetical protein
LARYDGRCKDLAEYPENDKFLWKEARNQMVLNVHHPLFLLKLLTNAARVDAVPSEKTALTVRSFVCPPLSAACPCVICSDGSVKAYALSPRKGQTALVITPDTIRLALYRERSFDSLTPLPASAPVAEGEGGWAANETGVHGGAESAGGRDA